MLVDTEYTDSLCAGTIYATTNITGNRFGCNPPTVKTPFIPYALPHSPVGSDAAAVNVSYSDGPIAPAMVPDGSPYIVNKVGRCLPCPCRHFPLVVSSPHIRVV